jgi:hypothetical protein
VPVVEAEVGQAYSYDAGAVDEDSDALTYSIVTGPAGAAINGQSGVLTFNATGTGVQEVVIKVEDGRGGSATQRFVVEVLE